ncbi:MAG: Xaa-Pro peptidase family protein [Candidatus Auribacterota bacterium]
MKYSNLFEGTECEALLIIDSSEQNMDLYYLTRFFAPDAFACVITPEQSSVIVSDLEHGRACMEAKVDFVLRQIEYAQKYSDSAGNISVTMKAVISVLKEKNIRKVLVPQSFAVLYADILRAEGFELCVKQGPLVKQRMIKTADELNYIAHAVLETENVLEDALNRIACSEIRDGKLYYENTMLTAEKLKNHIAARLLERGYLSLYTIVACGEQGCDPHHQGSGPLYAHTPIIIDVFPRSLTNFYFADMTRTVVRGTPDPYVVSMFNSVARAHQAAVDKITDGVPARDVHKAVLDVFEKDGFKTGLIDNMLQGFIHSTGHGVGLDIHENPRVANVDDILTDGMVVTVEPGLYYRGFGGVRLEDLVVVTGNGAANFNRLPKQLVVAP